MKLLCCFLLFYAQLWATQADKALAPEKALFDASNRERIQRGLPELKWNDKLASSARLHAKAMAAAHMLSHRVAGELGLTDRIAATGLHFIAAGENIAYASDPGDDVHSQEIHSGWMQSEGHRANILSRSFNSIGIGIFKSDGLLYAVQDFAHVIHENGIQNDEAELAKAINAARMTHGLRELKVVSSEALHTSACDMAKKNQVNVRLIPVERNEHASFAFTTGELGALPDAFRKLVTGPNVEVLETGICFAVSSKYPGGVYWVAAIY